MKRKIIIIIIILWLSILPLLSFADDNKNQRLMKMEKESLSRIEIPDELKNELKKRKIEYKTHGYIKTNNDYATYLLNLPQKAPLELKAYKMTDSKEDTHLKASLNEVQLAFKFPEDLIKHDKIIGFAPIGTYIKSNPSKKYHDGWTGVKILFHEENIGVCSFTFFNLDASQGTVILNNQNAEKLNKKYSSHIISGSKESGFLYDLNWFETGKMSQLSCANKIFNKDIMPRILSLGTSLDKKISLESVNQ